MAKRSRLAGRPGQRRPLQRSTTSKPATSAPSTSITPEEEARAAELEAAIVAEEKAATTARERRGRRDTVDSAGSVAYSSVPLSVREAQEYRYVQRDVRRILVVGGFLLAILAVLEVLVNGLHLFTL
ncbi:MAG TPA: hypothetical protein VH440_08650 [Candidatus Limnocylindrales bacterium]|jgi:hypothetical protein